MTVVQAYCIPKIGKEKEVTIEDMSPDGDMVHLRITTFTQYEWADIVISDDELEKLLEPLGYRRIDNENKS